ncbi:PAS domain S-box protein [Aquincola sp. S2]|uniref:histidine kinase n=1 Tax=Pseudaquabacterium terrae TaxID=2732868 RepID=A0ABX2EL61_9BURK|nr:PAS domain S-box protein [Aquabacterium terrae]NRF69264.1 PAS domain S-box protein [Aquabacterium terrae]
MRHDPDRAEPADRGAAETPPLPPAQTPLFEPAGALPEPAEAPLPPHDEFARLAARVLCRFVLLLGGLLLASAAIEAVLADNVGRVPLRAWLAIVAMLGGGIGLLLERQGRHRAASLTIVLVLLLAALGHAAGSGLGLHSLALAGISLLVVIAGVLLTLRAALLVAGLHLAGVVALYIAQREGWLLAPDAALRLVPEARLIGLVLLIGAALLGALTLSRPLQRSLQRALNQERRLSQLLRLGSDWAWELGPDGRIQMLTPSFEHHTGRTVAEFLQLGRPGGPSIVDDHDWRAVQQALRSHAPFRELVVSYRCVDDSLLVVKASGEPMRDERGRFLGWWGVSRNVTAEIQSQRELQRSRDMLDRLFRESPDAIFVAPVVSGKLTMFNDAFMRLTGFGEEELLGRNGIELGLWRGSAQPLLLRDQLLQQGLLRDQRSVIFNKSGERRHVLISAGRFEWDGEAVGVFSARDITEVERAWAEGEAILNNASVGVALVREHVFERINPAFERMYGRPVGSLRGAPVAALFVKSRHFERFFAVADEAFARGETVDVERRALRPDGSTLLVRLRGRAVDGARPRESGAIWVAEDISESRRVEQALAEARNQAEAASQAKSAFLASMSHEIRTPLNGVLGLARLLLDPALDATQRQDYLRLLAESAEGLSGIVSGVLDLTKIEAGRLQVERVPFDLAGLVDSAFGAFATLGRERGLEMRCEIDEALPLRVLGDPVRLRQILSNYLSNALKFTHRGTITLRVIATAAPQVRLVVEDSGIGVAPQVRERLFQPFEQADGSTTRRFGGTGLGLSICRQLAELMGGAVGMDSDGSSGSVFWLELPLPEVTDSAGSDSAGAGIAPPQALDGLRVLVAEDNPVNMLIIVALLRRLGALPLEAENGEQALALARAQAATLDAVLMDLHMPVLDGLAAARALREDPRTAALPVIALSAAVLEIERQQARQAGMCDFIAKPVDQAELLRALGRLRPVQI